MAVKTVESYVPRQILAVTACEPLRLPATIPANAGDIDAGQVVGIRTADGYLKPVRRGLLAANAANAATTLDAGAANIDKFKVGDVVAIRTLNGATVQNLGAVTAKGATTVTVTTAVAQAYTANQAYVYVADGSEVAKGVMEYAVLNDSDSQGVSPYAAGVFRESDLIGFDDVALGDLGARRTFGGLVIVPC